MLLLVAHGDRCDDAGGKKREASLSRRCNFRTTRTRSRNPAPEVRPGVHTR